MSGTGIIIVGSLNPHKKCQDRVRIFSRGGCAPTIRATDYKDPPKILCAEQKGYLIADRSQINDG